MTRVIPVLAAVLIAGCGGRIGLNCDVQYERLEPAEESDRNGSISTKTFSKEVSPDVYEKCITYTLQEHQAEAAERWYPLVEAMCRCPVTLR